MIQSVCLLANFLWMLWSACTENLQYWKKNWENLHSSVNVPLYSKFNLWYCSEKEKIKYLRKDYIRTMNHSNTLIIQVFIETTRLDRKNLLKWNLSVFSLLLSHAIFGIQILIDISFHHLFSFPCQLPSVKK